MKLGGGGRFKKLSESLMRKGYSKDSAAKISAVIGRKKYGKKAFARLSLSK